MQALHKLALTAVPSKCSLIGLQTLAPASCICQTSLRQYASDIKVTTISTSQKSCRAVTTRLGSFTLQKTAKDESKGNWVTDGVKATVGEVGKVIMTC